MKVGHARLKPNSARTLWLGVGLLFGLMALSWFVLFAIAAEHPVTTVPLEHRSAP